MHWRQEMLAIEYLQIILTLRNNKLSCIFYSRTLQIPQFFIPFYCSIFSPFPILATENYNFFILKRITLQSGTININRRLMLQQTAVITFQSHFL
jgi:hypothetical protein